MRLTKKYQSYFDLKLIETRPSYDRYVRVSQQDKRTSFVCSFLGIKLAPDGLFSLRLIGSTMFSICLVQLNLVTPVGL